MQITRPVALSTVIRCTPSLHKGPSAVDVLKRLALLSIRAHFISSCFGGHSAGLGILLGRCLGDPELELLLELVLELDDDETSCGPAAAELDGPNGGL